MIAGSKPQRIEPQFYTKIWGSPRIEPWFESRGDTLTGEVWFPAGDLLIKFLFTSQDLSIQVHPDDEYALANEQSCGKTEMWHILRADPGARIAVGFRESIARDKLVSLAENGEIVNRLQWVEVHRGDTFLIPAGTVHAIKAGIALCEIQQNSDITYRLYDYGRDRPLHLQQAAKVADLGVHPGKSVPLEMGGGVRLLAQCPYFRTYSVTASQPASLHMKDGSRFVIVLEGAGLVNGIPVAPGQVLKATGSPDWQVEPVKRVPSDSLKLLLTG